MSKRRLNRKTKRIFVNGLNFIILPIIFFILIYLISYFTLVPFFAPILPASGIFITNTQKTFSSDKNYNNIFVPIEEAETVPIVTDPSGGKSVDGNGFVFPKYGDCFGQLIYEECGINCQLFFGDDQIALKNGAGMYNGSFIPGYGGTTLVAGHNHTFFNSLQYAEKGQEITIKTSYGNYKYKVTGVEVKKFNDNTAYNLSVRDKCRLILYTCYPFDELGLTSRRFFVYADMIEGVLIDMENSTEVR